MTSEDKRGIMRQPEDTCGTIDGWVGDHFRAIETEVRNLLSSEGNEHIAHVLDQILIEAENGLEGLEDVRRSNVEIRMWGQQWKDEAKKRSRSAAIRDLASMPFGEVHALERLQDAFDQVWYASPGFVRSDTIDEDDLGFYESLALKGLAVCEPEAGPTEYKISDAGNRLLRQAEEQ